MLHGFLLAVREDQWDCIWEVILAFSLYDGTQCVSPMLVVWTLALESDGVVQFVDADLHDARLSDSWILHVHAFVGFWFSMVMPRLSCVVVHTCQCVGYDTVLLVE